MSQSALTLTQRNSLHFKAGWQIHGSHAPFCPPISMSGMLNDKDAISYWAFWESSSTQHSRQSGDQSQRESRNSFAIPTLTRCKSIPQKNHSKCILTWFFLLPQIWFACFCQQDLLLCIFSTHLSTGSCGPFPANWQSPASHTGVSYSLRTSSGPVGASLALRRDNPEMGENYEERSLSPTGQRRDKGTGPHHPTVGRFWCVGSLQLLRSPGARSDSLLISKFHFPKSLSSFFIHAS